MSARSKGKKGFLEKSIDGLTETLEYADYCSRISEDPGLLQTLDPRTKICGAVVLILGATITAHTEMIGVIFSIALVLIALSHISFALFVKQTWVGVLWFTGVLAVPAIFTTPGNILIHVPLTHWPVTAQGLQTAIRLLARAETAATVVLLLILSTPWVHLLKALRAFHTPVILVTIFGMTHRYIFLLLHLARDLFEARRSRQVGPLTSPQLRQLAGSSAGVLMNRSLQLSEEVYLAMQSRGFHGEIYLIDHFQFGKRDAVAFAFIFCLSLIVATMS